MNVKILTKIYAFMTQKIINVVNKQIALILAQIFAITKTDPINAALIIAHIKIALKIRF